MSTKKLSLVQKALRNPAIAAWYVEEYAVTADIFTVANVREYGISGKGTVADFIISDGVADGVLMEEEAETNG